MEETRRKSLKTSTHVTVFLSAFIVTIFFLQWWQRAIYPSWMWIMIGSGFGLGFGFGFVSKRKDVFRCIMLMAAGIGLAFLTVARTTHVPSASIIDTYAHGQTVTILGIISDAPDDQQTSIDYTIDVRGIQASATGAAIPVNGKVLVTDLRHWPRYHYGDALEISGQLQKPKPTKTFAYDQYLSRFGIVATMKAAHITFVSGDHGNPLIAALITIRERFEAQINRVFPEPEASFLAGLLTGSRSGLPDDLTQDFKRTGLTHIIAISGSNITIVIALIGGCLFFIPLRWRFVPSVIAIVLFTLLVGASASVVRAAIMGILGLLALQTGRIRNVRLAILWTAFVMLLWNPSMLWYDAGFQLSFLAVIGLAETSPILERWMKTVPTMFGMREALTMTIAAQIFALPWVALQFGMISLISPVANIIVAPLIPLAMLCGFLGTILSFVCFPLGQVVGWLGYGCLELIVMITHILAALPFAALSTRITVPMLLGLYSMIVIGVLWLRTQCKQV